ncbi:MAG: hypothetical protein II943_05095 [Victivallales bacterium]|nr:hypothetical protein [Victivallales bacterium]
MSREAEIILAALQTAVEEELERKAKLGYMAVVGDKHGSPRVVSARYLVRKLRALRMKSSVHPKGAVHPKQGV